MYRERGIVPLRLFEPSEKKLNVFSFPILLGIPPCKLLSVPSISMIDERFSKESGILPSRLFFLKLNTCSFDNDPSPAGRLPVRLFPSKLRLRRFEQ